MGSKYWNLKVYAYLYPHIYCIHPRVLCRYVACYFNDLKRLAAWGGGSGLGLPTLLKNIALLVLDDLHWAEKALRLNFFLSY